MTLRYADVVPSSTHSIANRGLQSLDASDDDDSVLVLATRFGGAVSYVLTDPSYRRFRVPGIDGVIAYRREPGCLLAIGDPVCHPDAVDDLAGQFRDACAREGRRVVYAASSEAFASRCIEHGYAAIEFGQEIVLDPREDRLSGANGRELRKKVQRAGREGVSVREYRGDDSADIEEAMWGVACAWLAARRGLQAFIAPIRRFKRMRGRRYFYAVCGESVVGVLSLVRMDAREGWSIQHLLHRPDGPSGISEILVTHSLQVVRDEGATCVSFGPAPLSQLGRVYGIDGLSAAGARVVFDSAGKLFGLGGIQRFREKFGVARREPNFLLFYPHISALATYGLLRAFNAH